MILEEVFAIEQIGFPILSTLILLPVLCAVVLAFVRDDGLARKVAFGGASLTLVLALVMAVGFVSGTSDIQFAERAEWMPSIGVGYFVGVDGISVLFIPLTAFLTLLVMLLSWGTVRFLTKGYLIALLGLEAATIGVFASLDLLLFFVFWELMLVPSYFLLKMWGTGPRRQYAGTKYVMYMLVGSAPLLVGIVVLGVNHFNVTGEYSFDFVALLETPASAGIQTLIFFLLAFGFAVKGPLFPFHTWMASVFSEGPVGMSVMLIGLKMGIYGFIRFAIPLAPEAASEWFWLIAVLGLIAIIYGALIALVQPNLRRLLAFSSVSHVGLATLGMFTLSTQGFQGGILMLVNMGIASAGLFFLAGFLYARTGSWELGSFGGAARTMPLLAVFFFIVGLASIGTPGTSGFPAEFLIFLGAFQVHWALAVVAVVGIILSAGYFFVYYERAFFGPVTRDAVRKATDLRPRETAIAAALVVVIFFIGLFPAPLLNMTSGSTEALAERIEAGPSTQLAQDELRGVGDGD
ncbi:MAG: NADH-quinone oxidoreductase subunit M [Actinomycetota bacterium]|jgi:NADH-quinone oxidoreductase subunit M|nr:NADH-quinone oxidoreductase subunit M [Actinomycetota bacterium]